MPRAEQLIDDLIKNGAEFKNPPEVVQPHAEGGPAPVSSEASEPPKVIEADDAEGRQAGDPNAPIELPAEVLAIGPKMFKMLAGDDPVLEDAILAKPINPTMPPMPKLSEVMAKPLEEAPVPVMSEQTRLEMEAGKKRVDEITAALPPADVTPAGDPNIALAFAPRNEQAPVAPVPTMTAQTRSEMEAGRQALERRRADAVYGQRITAEAAAKRMEDGAAPSSEDLSYSAPKGS